MIRHRITMALAVLFTLLSSHAGAQPEPVFRVDLESGIPVSMSVEPPPQVIEAGSAPPPRERPPEQVPALRKLHPLLLSSLDSDTPTHERVVIAFESTVPIPRFPELDPKLPRNNAKNAPARAAAERLVRELQGKRAATYRQHEADIARQGGRVIETFWLIDAVVAEMPLKNLVTFAASEQVLSIAPVASAEPPPADDENDKNDVNGRDCPPGPAPDTNDLNDVEDGRKRIGSDLYFDLNGGFIGLLDTGIRSTHRQFKGPSTIDLQLDCVNGGANCMASGNTDDDCWNHGTSTAAILTGNGNAGVFFRGVTKITVDSFKVYPSIFDGCDCDNIKSGLDTAAAVRGFQAAVAALDKVIVAEMQQHLQNGPVSLAANAAFDTGAVVVAANGNRRLGDEKVASPAEASRVIGVGDFDVINPTVINSQRIGPTWDDRIKPDLQGPTNTETAGNGCMALANCSGTRKDDALRVFGATSGATPYAAGAAALMRNLVARATRTNAVDPGFVYALMILAGQQPKFDDKHGVGRLQLPTDGTLLWGAVNVRHGDTFEVPIHVLPHQKVVDAALWWPEEPGRHNNVDLTIVDPDGKREVSNSLPSIFERARVDNAAKGKWRILIHGRSVPLGPQRVHFAILSQPVR